MKGTVVIWPVIPRPTAQGRRHYSTGSPANIVVLPVVRIERHEEPLVGRSTRRRVRRSIEQLEEAVRSAAELRALQEAMTVG